MLKKLIVILIILIMVIGCFSHVQADSTEKDAEITTEPETQPELKPEVIEAIKNKNNPYLYLVNPKNSLRAEYKPSNLVNIKKLSTYNSKYISARQAIYMEKTAAKNFLQMLKDANKKYKYKFYLHSGYRTYKEQKSSCYGRNTAIKGTNGYIAVAAPGTSEHQTGLAIDVTGLGNSKSSKTPKKGTPERWLIDNCHKYGFIYRYQSKFSKETGVMSEPWHLRYVGVEDATKIHKKGISLEKYIQSYNKNYKYGKDIDSNLTYIKLGKNSKGYYIYGHIKLIDTKTKSVFVSPTNPKVTLKLDNKKNKTATVKKRTDEKYSFTIYINGLVTKINCTIQVETVGQKIKLKTKKSKTLGSVSKGKPISYKNEKGVMIVRLGK